MELIQNAFEQGLIPGIVIVIYLIINKIIDNNKRNPLDDIAKLLNIVTRDIIEKDREKGLFNLPKKIIGSACSRTCLCPVWKAVRGD